MGVLCELGGADSAFCGGSESGFAARIGLREKKNDEQGVEAARIIC